MVTLIYKVLVVVFICCGIQGKITWDTAWIDNNKPYTNGTEIEPPPNATYLSTVCPASSGGTLALQCQANKGAPFHVFQNNSVLHFVATCDPRLGILCNPYVGYNATCPDMSMNFGCDVPDPTTTTTTTTTTATTTSGPRTSLKSNSGSTGSTMYLHRSLRGGGPDPTTSTTQSSTKPLPSSTNRPTSTRRPTTAAPATSSSTRMTQSTTSLIMSSNKQPNAGYVTSGSNGGTSVSISSSPNGHVGSGGQCQCQNSRNGAGSVVYNGWMIIVLALIFV